MKLEYSDFLQSSPRGEEVITTEKISHDDVLTDSKEVHSEAEIHQESCKFDHTHFALVQYAIM